MKLCLLNLLTHEINADKDVRIDLIIDCFRQQTSPVDMLVSLRVIESKSLLAKSQFCVLLLNEQIIE